MPWTQMLNTCQRCGLVDVKRVQTKGFQEIDPTDGKSHCYMMYTYFRTLDENPLAASQLHVGDAAVRVQQMSKRVVCTIAWTDGTQSS